MSRRFGHGLLLAGLLLLCRVSVAEAQEPSPQQEPAQTEAPAPGIVEGWLRGRFALHANYGYQVGSSELRDRLEFRAYGETASFLATHDITGGGLFDVGGHYLVWRELSVGATYTETKGSDATTVTGTVPHPIQVASPRTIQPQMPALRRDERATHIHVGWLIPLPVDKLDLRVTGGPTYFNLTQGVVTGVDVSETGVPPFDVVNVDRLRTGELIKNAWGGHAGVDVSYMLSPRLGLGGFVRFARGTATLPSGDTSVSVTVGGFQMGGGVRVRF